MSASADRCSEIIREFDSQGWHRTATDVDEQSCDWLASRLRSLGLDPEIDTFPFSRVDPESALVTAGDVAVEAYPLIDSELPPPESVLRGRFASESGDGDIALLHFDQHAGDGSLDELRRGKHQAIVVAVEGFPGAFTLLNAWDYDEPHGPPVIQVPAEAWVAFDAARREGADVSIRCGAQRTDTTAANVLARVAGTGRELAPLVVLTPRSGWWYCAGERGGGIAVLLEVARAIQAQPLRREVVFLATTGHELGFLGVKRYLERDPALATGAAFWVHLGANIGAVGAQLYVRSATQSLIDTARAAGFPGATYQHSDTPIGEASIVHQFGGEFVSLVGGGFPRFHSTADRWPDAIDASNIAAQADAMLLLLHTADTTV